MEAVLKEHMLILAFIRGMEKRIGHCPLICQILTKP
jgi:hypothetical protein